MTPNNIQNSMTRRFPQLPKKVLMRDSKIVAKLVLAWDLEQDSEKVLDIYLKEQNNLSDERYWELMRTVWILCGSVENADTFRKLMQSKRKQKHYFSTPEEAKKLREMSDSFEAYRATNDPKDGGLSWTISKEYALYYKETFDKSILLSGEFYKKDVFAYIERNNEYEIIIL